jgi:hypothetical protein
MFFERHGQRATTPLASAQASGTGLMKHGLAHRAGLVLLAIAALTIAALPSTSIARAEDRIAALGRMLGSTSEKVRLSAVLALAKLGEPRVDKPLIRALHDTSPRVRTVAAAALGQLDCGAALPVLRQLARHDDDPSVRSAATAATMKITTAGASGAQLAERGHPADRAAGDVEPPRARRAPPGDARSDSGHAAFAAMPHPDLYVLVNSSNDESPGTDPATRKLHADILRRTLLDRFRADASITSAADDARRWGLDARHLDLSVTRLAATRAGNLIEVDAQLRVAISDEGGKMLSLLSGGAKVQVPAATFDTRYLPALHKEALENAMRGMVDKLLGQLRGAP